MTKQVQKNSTPVEPGTAAKFFGYTFLGLVLLILAALAVKLVLWILGI